MRIRRPSRGILQNNFVHLIPLWKPLPIAGFRLKFVTIDGVIPDDGGTMNQNGALMQLVPFAAVALIFYFLLIRPQQKQLKETKTMLEALKPGDKVITRGGMIGVITAMKGDEVELEIAKGIKADFTRSAVGAVLNAVK
jgi:preprotein translocase subunit YajC